MITTEESNLYRHSEALAEESKIDCHSEEDTKSFLEKRQYSESTKYVSTDKMLKHLTTSSTDAGSQNSFLVCSLCEVQHDRVSFVKQCAFTFSCKSFRSNPLTALLCSRSSRFSLTKCRSLAAHSYGFTLAEVLITLSILGVVAAIMIPSTMHKIQDTQQLAGFKRAYSMLDNALQMMYVVEGLPSTWSDWPSTAEYNSSNANYFAQKLAKYLAVQKYCGADEGCYGYGYLGTGICSTKRCFKGLNGNIDNDAYRIEYASGKMILKNNMRLSLSARYANHPYTKSRCLGGIRVDINGPKGPNRLGHDVFYFAYDEKGIQTKPGQYCLTAGGSKNRYSDACNKTRSSEAGAGTSCSIWIMRHNNMDYKYRDVSAEW